MASHFKIAADASFTVDVTEFYQDPVGGEYDPEYEWEGRGSVQPCLSGVIIQDFGIDMQDRKILIRDNDAMKQSHVDALDVKWQVKDAKYYFTDGIHIFKIQFQRSPRGWRKWLNTKLYFKGLQISQPPPERYVWYSYEIILLVREMIS